SMSAVSRSSGGTWRRGVRSGAAGVPDPPAAGIFVVGDSALCRGPSDAPSPPEPARMSVAGRS
ncbi:MAG TPA: hypothetical protein VMD51_12325, partial [Mycobacterium sp.]|nr:hypothetical protein [Mycobacterium sp.]